MLLYIPQWPIKRATLSEIRIPQLNSFSQNHNLLFSPVLSQHHFHLFLG